MVENRTDAPLELESLRVRSREWTAAWRELVKLTGDTDRMAECPLSGETWGYMCTFRRGDSWVHEFRHRNHPALGRRWLLHVKASVGWSPEDERRTRRTLH